MTVQNADCGDTTTCVETLIEAAEQAEMVRPDGAGIEEIVGDKGYHSNQSLVDLEAVGVRSYISEPDRGRRNWKKNSDARDAVYRNRRRTRRPRGVQCAGCTNSPGSRRVARELARLKDCERTAVDQWLTGVIADTIPPNR